MAAAKELAVLAGRRPRRTDPRLRDAGAPRGAIPVLTWGGLRGGISVALALALPDSPYKPVLLAATYGVVIFSIIVQGLTVGRLVRAVVR